MKEVDAMIDSTINDAKVIVTSGKRAIPTHVLSCMYFVSDSWRTASRIELDALLSKKT